MLNQDCTLNSGTITIDGTTISNVDLNGHKITSNTDFTFRTKNNSNISNGTIEMTADESTGIDIYGANSSNITIDNVTIQGETYHAFGIAIWGGMASVSSTTINLPGSTGMSVVSGEYSESEETFGSPNLNVIDGTEINARDGITCFNGANASATINIGDASIYCTNLGLGTDGGEQYTGDAVVNIGYPNGSTLPVITGEVVGIFSGNANSEINVENGIISGSSGIDVLGGNLNLCGGRITGNGNPNEEEPPENDLGFTWNGSALFIEQKPISTNDYGNANITIGGQTAGQPILESFYTSTIGTNATG